MSRPEVIEGYLAEVARWLPGRRRTRADRLDELRDGLHEFLDQQPPLGRDEAAARLVREFGDPGEIGAAIAGELRIRLARRHAILVLLLLSGAGLGWHTYHTLVGVPASIVPGGWRGWLFAAGIDLLRTGATVAQVAAAGAAVLASVRPPAVLTRLASPRLLEVRLPQLLTGVTVAAVAGFGAGALVMTATAAAPYRGYLLLLVAPVLVVALLAARGSHRALRQAAHPPAAPGAGPAR